MIRDLPVPNGDDSELIASLRESQALLAASQRMAKVGSWVLDLGDLGDLSRNPLRWSDETYRIFGYEPGSVEVTNDLFFSHVHPDDQPRIQESVAAALRNDTAYEIENRIILRDGTEKVVYQWAEIERDAEGRPRRLLGSCQDVTERRRAEESLRAGEARYRHLADSMPQLVWTADAGGKVDYYNSRAVEYAGIRQAGDGTWSWEPVVHPDELQLTVDAWRFAIENLAAYACEHRIRMADGSFRWHLSRALPMRGPDGAVKWFGTATDVHALREAQEALRASDRSKDEFLATLAHELRNPLNPIRSAVQVLRIHGPDIPELRWCRDVIDRQVDHLTRLIDDLLDVSRITRGKLELRKQRVGLAEVLERAVESSRPLLDSHRQELTVALPAEPVFLNGDLVRLAQTFMNLLDNAIKYTPAGGRIGITAERRDGEVAVSVKDTGIGIPPEKLAQLFDMFYQVDRSLERSHGGLGIGLTLVRRLVEMHGGTVEARSEGADRGSEFVVRLPVLAEEPAPPPAAIQETGRAAARRILVVDDNRDSADSLSLLLQVTGHDVRTAYDGQEALVEAGRFLPDVVLLDIGMPKLNGYEAARRIRDEPWGKKMLLIAQTGWGQEEDRRRSREAGFDAHLTKPVDHLKLLKLLG